MRTALPLLTGLVLLLAGCAGGGSDADVAPPSPAAHNEETGGILGRVLDDESIPVPNAQVTLLPENLQIVTDPVGVFRFNKVEPGNHTLIANRTGYEGAEKRFDVMAGEVVTPTIIVNALKILDPYTTVYPGTIYLQFAYKDVHRHAALSGISCSPCETWWHTQPGVSDGRLEVVWTPSINLPMVNQAFRFGLSVNAWNGSYHGAEWQATGDSVWGGVLKSREGYNFEYHDPRKFPANETLTMVHADTPDGENLGFNQRIQVWLTLAYDMTLPEDYTILPPS